MYVIASAVYEDPERIRESHPEIWRQVRRFNAPSQLAVAAGLEVASKARSPKNACLLSLAPCQPGSPELFSWADNLVTTHGNGDFGGAKMNPTHTLHAIDNLTLSALAIALENHSYSLGLGGSPGQSWEALEQILDRFQIEDEQEAVLVAGDQENALTASPAKGVAILFSSRPRMHDSLKRSINIRGILRSPLPSSIQPVMHSVHGLSELIHFISAMDGPSGLFTYDVLTEHGNGTDQFTIMIELS